MHYVVSIPLDPGLAEFIGKKGSENSITFYNRKVDGNTIVVLAPTSIEERFYAIAETILIADQVVISTTAVDKLFGEMVVGCSLLDGKRIIFTKDNDVKNMLDTVKLKNYELADREELLSKILSHARRSEGNGIRVDIDKAFPVKGLGTVALGIVKRGTLKAHDELFHSGTGKKVSVRSLQSQDVDIQEADIGTRVGIVLKGIEPDEMDKGDLLTNIRVSPTDTITAKITMNPVSKEEFKIDTAYDLIHNFSYVKAAVKGIDGDKVTFKLAKAISIEKGDEFLLMRGRAPRIFAKGKAE